MNKTEIKKLFKENGMVTVPKLKLFNNSPKPRRALGFKGGSFGPLTVTQAYLEKNREIETKVANLIAEHNITNVTFTWHQIHPYSPAQHMDPTDKDFYYVLNWR
jgi:hypothetical protein